MTESGEIRPSSHAVSLPTEFTSHLRQDEYGIWTSGTQRVLSYPATGNEECADIEDESLWFRHRNDCIAAIVHRFKPPGTMLDVGGGNGFVARRLLDEGIPCVLVEPGSAGTVNARVSRGIPHVIRCSLDECSMPPGSVGGVGLFDVLEHLEDERAALAKIHEMLIPGGMLYITVPAYPWLWSRADVDAGHFRRYTRASLDAALQSRYDVLFSSHLFSMFPIPVLAIRRLPYLILGNRAPSVLSPRREHGADGGWGAGFARWLMARELSRLNHGRSIPFGTSLLAAARKRCITPDSSPVTSAQP